MYMIKIQSLAICILLLGTTGKVLADDAGNIQACVSKAKEFANVLLNEFDVIYEGNWIDLSVAKWTDHDTVCKVKFESVYDLRIKGKIYIYEGFAGQESYNLNNKLQKHTEEAIEKMESRITLLEKRMEKVTNKLRTNDPDHSALKGYINIGIERALSLPASPT